MSKNPDQMARKIARRSLDVKQKKRRRLFSVSARRMLRKAFGKRFMLEEGYTPQEVERILTLFAERLEALEKMVPDGGVGFYTSYLELLNTERPQ